MTIAFQPTTSPRPVLAPSAVRRRQYQIRRRVFAALVVLSVLAGFKLAAVLGDAPASIPEHRVTSYVVQPGDTLWSIVAELRPGAEPGPIVAELLARNGGPTLQPGQQLELTW